MEILMPDTIAPLHPKIVQNYIRTGHLFRDGNISTFLKTKDKFLRRVNIMVKTVYYQTTGTIELLGAIREVSNISSISYVMYQSKKNLLNVEAASQKFCEQTGLHPFIFDNYPCSLSVLCPELRVKLSPELMKIEKTKQEKLKK